MKKFAAIISSAALLFSLSACGGGGGTGGGSSASPLGSNPNQGVTPPTSQSPNGSVIITKTSLVFNETTTVNAVFKKSDGTVAAGVSVNFSTTLGTLTPATAVTTDANGLASVQLTVGSVSGSGQVTASATVDGKLVSLNALFTVNLPTLKLSPITLGLTNLSYGGSTSVSVSVLDSNNNPFTTQEVDVVFTSTQTTSGNAKLNTPVRTINGVATTTYQATKAIGVDTITASIAGASVNATVTVSPLSASSIQFISALPTNIGLRGMGGAGIQETSFLTFRVLDTAGQPRANQQVDFSLNTTIGGLLLLAPSGSTATDGTVSVIVKSGTIATSVRVTATITGSSPAISTQSDILVVSTGVPAQDGLSISFSDLSPEGFDYDGVTTTVTARMSDHFHNPVPDGTAVYFTTNAGSIEASCTTTKGACSVVWTSQAPRNVNGRVTILAYAIGEEAFLDLNGNGVADAGEFTDTSEAFRDDNENGIRDPGETFIDYNKDGVFNLPDGLYNGVLQGAAYVGAPKSKHIFSNSFINMASSFANISSSCGSGITIAPTGSKACNITVVGTNGNSMPSGTKVEFTFTPTPATATGMALSSSDYVFPSSNARSGITTSILLKDGNTAPPAGSGIFTVKVTTPKGNITTLNTPVN